MVSDERSAGPTTVVYTDGACQGNPGPGGWAWAVPGGRWRSGAERRTTNQRMEVTAVLDALGCLDGPLEVVSDSTYVVNCFKNGWWKKWVVNGWVSSSRQPVANRDLWEPLVEMYRHEPSRFHFRWVKGHSADPYNDLVDRLAVAAASSGRGDEGDRPPGVTGPADQPRATRPQAAGTRAAGTRAAGTRAAGTRAAGPEMARAALAGLRPPGEPVLREAGAGDVAGVLSLWEAVGAESLVARGRAALAALVTDRPGSLVVADAGGRLVGAVIAAYDGWSATLYGLAVDPGWQHRGTAALLVGEAERRLVAQGATSVTAEPVGRTPEQAGLWEPLGYLPDDVGTRYGRQLGGA